MSHTRGVTLDDPFRLLDGIEQRLETIREQAETLRAEMAAVSVTERDEQRGITVTVDHTGNLTDLELTAAARAEPALAQHILRVLRTARGRLPDAVVAGAPSARRTPQTLAAVVSGMRAMFPEPEPEPPSAPAAAHHRRFVPEDLDTPAPPPRARPAPAVDPAEDDDYFDGDYLDRPGQDRRGGRR